MPLLPSPSPEEPPDELPPEPSPSPVLDDVPPCAVLEPPLIVELDGLAGELDEVADAVAV